MIEFGFSGWANLKNKVFFLEGNIYIGIEFTTLVTSCNKIKIYLDQEKCSYLQDIKYHNEYLSKQGFTVGRIYSLIFENYLKYIDDLFAGDSKFIDNLALVGFRFDEKTNSVYPNCDYIINIV